MSEEGKKKIHMVAICGTGMTALAGLLKSAGHAVTGSDQNVYPPMSELLSKLKIPCFQGFRPDQIPADTDLVVIGNAVSKSNPEVLAVQERGIPYLSMPQALSMFFLRQREPIIVAGTHGKTTTTSLLAWVLEAAGEDPGLLVGGWAKNFDGNHKLGTGRWFVVEGDEYDTAFFDKGPKFLHYRPRYAILTGVEFDHGDIYPTLEAVKSAFSRFIRLVPPQGFLMAGSEGGSVAEIIREAACPVETYGIGPGVDWEARSIDFAGELTRFEAVRRGRLLGRFDLPLMGLHNVKNALSVVALASHLGLSPEKIRAGLKSFAGVRRRQEVVGVENGVLVIDDFAHHPTAIAETIAAVKGRYPGRRLWAIFEPRSATSRRNVFQEAFVEALTGADRPVMVDLFSPEKVAAEVRLNPRKVVEGLVARGKEALFFSNADAVVEGISPILSSGDVILVMSSGGFDGIHRKLLRAIAKV